MAACELGQACGLQVIGKNPAKVATTSPGVDMELARSVVLAAAFLIPLAAGCSDSGRRTRTWTAMEGDAGAPSRELADRDMIVFLALPVVDDSEATLRAKEVEELKGTLAFLCESVGIELPGGAFQPLLKAGTVAPVECSQVVSTAQDGQREIDMTFIRRKDQQAAKSQVIGKVRIIGVRSAATGTPRIELHLKMQLNGDLIVSARDQATGKPLRLRQIGG